MVIAKIWQKRRAAPLADLETQNEEVRMELQTLRHELQEVQERLDFAERAVTQQRRLDALPNPLPRPGSGNV